MDSKLYSRRKGKITNNSLVRKNSIYTFKKKNYITLISKIIQLVFWILLLFLVKKWIQTLSFDFTEGDQQQYLENNYIISFGFDFERITKVFLSFILFLTLSPIIVIMSFSVILTAIKKERIILAKVVAIIQEENANEQLEMDVQNATLAKTLAEQFQHVTLHQTAKNGSMKQVAIYASKTSFFRFPKTQKIFNNLRGCCQIVNMEIQPFTQKEANHLLSLFESHCSTDDFQYAALVSVGEPAFQFSERKVLSVDKLARSMVLHSKGVEIHSFLTISKGSWWQFWRRRLKAHRLNNKKDDNGNRLEPSDDDKHFISETRMMKKSGYVLPEIVLLIKSNSRSKSQEVKEIMEGSLLTIFCGFTRKIDFKDISPQKVLNRIAKFRLVKRRRKIIAGLSAKAIIDRYYRPLTCVPFINEVTTPISLNRNESSHPIILGETTSGEYIRANLEDYKSHRLIVGTTGHGKSEFVMAEIEQLKRHYPEVRTIVLDFSGEYAKRFIRDTDTLIYEANNPHAPLHINPFENPEQIDQVEQIDFLYKYFCESLMLQTAYDYTPQMQRVLLGSLELVLNRNNKGEHNFSYFEYDLNRFVEENKDQLNLGDKSQIGILNRLASFKRMLKKVVWVDQSNWSAEELEDYHQIINLQKIRDHRTKAAIVNLILYKIRNYLIKRPHHLTKFFIYIEEAQLVVPELYRRSSAADLSFVEECLTEIRKWSAYLTLIGTSIDTISRMATESKFLINFGSHSLKLVNPMNYSQEKTESATTIHSLKKFQADIKLPNEEHVFRAVELPRPTRKALREEEYQEILTEDHRYQALREKSEVITKSIIDQEEEIKEERKGQTRKLFQLCLTDCPFYFYQPKNCLVAPSKTTKLKALLEKIAGRVCNWYNNNWAEVAQAFHKEYAVIKRHIKDLITEVIDANQRIRQSKITSEQKEALQQCVIFLLLKQLLWQQQITFEEAKKFLHYYHNEDWEQQIDDEMTQAKARGYSFSREKEAAAEEDEDSPFRNDSNGYDFTNNFWG
jgi:hypothetical protein